MVCVYVNGRKLQEMSGHTSPKIRRGMTAALEISIQKLIEEKMQVRFAKQSDTCCLLQGKHIN